MRELKSTPFAVKKISGREVTGVFSVFGNLDDYHDRIWPGAFAKTLTERGNRIVHLWQHDFSSPPIAIVREIKEVGRAELPPEVLERAPEAMGGAQVTREYLDTPRANEVLAALQAGSPLEMSFAYDPIKYDFEQLDGATYEWERIRNLRELRLYETSDVLWGANSATIADSKTLALPLDFLLRQLSAQLAQLRDDVKAGRRNSEDDQKRINQIAELAIELGADSVQKTPPPNDPALDDSGAKSRADEQSLTLTAASYRYKVDAAARALQLLQRSA